MSGHYTKKDVRLGRRFGRLRVLRLAGVRRYPSGGRQRMWVCLCVPCGKKTKRPVGEWELRSGGSQSCGCLRKERASAARHVDIPKGARFGSLRVVAQDMSVAGRQWRCRCACGAITVATTRALRSGHTTSCGCGQIARCAAMSEARTRRFTLDGVALTVMDLAEMCRVSYVGMHARLKSRGGDVEAAVAFRSRRGVYLSRAARAARALSQHTTSEAVESSSTRPEPASSRVGRSATSTDATE